ncbi:MAG: HAD-IB family hydrolase [Actinobacteria bacterium]|nr:HAD-IB family hydrolase [Actinomycetota bacterium]
MNITVAAFDVDNTLTVRDCVVPFMRSVAGTRRLMNVMLSDLGSTIQRVRRRDRDFLKAKFVHGVFEGKNAGEIQSLGVRFASKIADGWLRSDVAARMRWHQEQGHVVILVSASLGAYLHPLGDLLEVDAVLCTELEEVNGILTGKLDGKNCRGEEKASRVQKWCEGAGMNAEDLVYAYGDSSGDVELLELFSHGTWVNTTDLEENAA